MIEHSARLKQENSAIENNLKQQLEQLANSPNFKLYSELKKKLSKQQIESFRKKLQKNEQLFQYSNNLATKEFFKRFLQKRQNVTIGELIDDGGISKITPWMERRQCPRPCQWISNWAGSYQQRRPTGRSS